MLLLKGGFYKKKKKKEPSGLFTTPVNRDDLSLENKLPMISPCPTKYAFIKKQRKRRSGPQVISSADGDSQKKQNTELSSFSPLNSNSQEMHQLTQLLKGHSHVW